jgi:hypothetical protein
MVTHVPVPPSCCPAGQIPVPVWLPVPVLVELAVPLPVWLPVPIIVWVPVPVPVPAAVPASESPPWREPKSGEQDAAIIPANMREMRAFMVNAST